MNGNVCLLWIQDTFLPPSPKTNKQKTWKPRKPFANRGLRGRRRPLSSVAWLPSMFRRHVCLGAVLTGRPRFRLREFNGSPFLFSSPFPTQLVGGKRNRSAQGRRSITAGRRCVQRPGQQQPLMMPRISDFSSVSALMPGQAQGCCPKVSPAKEDPGRLLAETDGLWGQVGGGTEARRAPESPGPRPTLSGVGTWEERSDYS